MKKLIYLISIGFVIAPLSLYADSFNLSVTFCNGSDCGDVISPTVPTRLTATVVSPSQINLTWEASIDPGTFATGVAGYGIYRNGSATLLATTTGTSYSDTSLTPSTLYSYTITAFDVVHNESIQSSSVSTTTLSSSPWIPNPSSGSPTGTLAVGTTEIVLSLTTNLSSTCKYSTVAGTSYSNMLNDFSVSGGTLHSTLITGLINGTNRTFYVRCESALGYAMTDDYIISFAIGSPSTLPASGGGGGGGGGGGSTPTLPNLSEGVIVRGMAYPGSAVTLLKDGQFVTSTVAGPDAKFEINFSGITAGTYTFGIWAKDSRGNRSILFPFTVSLTKGVTNVISGVFIPPTISVDKKQVRRGDPVTVIGTTNPKANVSIFFNSPVELVKNVMSDEKGLWSYKMDTLELDYGNHTTHARSKKDSDISSISQKLGFVVGSSNIAVAAEATPPAGDFNNDNKVNLVDFSVMLYWYKRPMTEKTPPGIDMNNDGKINLIDFSIMAYHWTG